MTVYEPHAVQTAALAASKGKRGFNYYMEQGLGKTGTVLLEFAELVAERKATRLVVICPNSFKKGWQDEAAEWGLDFDFHLYQAGDTWGQDQFLKKEFKKPPVLVINYEAIRPKITKDPKDKRKKLIIWNDGMKFIQKFVDGRKAYLANDESIQISTHDALQTVGVDLLADLFQFVRNLSGKPVKQGPHDLYSQLRVLRAINMNYYVFKNLFCKMGGFKGKTVLGAMNEEGLAAILDPVTFRATKADWTDLPPKIFMPPVEYELTAEQKAQYRAMHDEFVLWLNEDEFVSIDAALTKYIKLAQIQAGFIFDADKRVRMLVEPEKNPRLATLEMLLDEHVTGKAIVVYNHKPVRTMLAERFAHLRPVFIHGGMTDDDISVSKQAFNGDRDCRIICITKAAKYGHTLLGNQDRVEDACSDEIFYENTYNLDDRSQLEDRPHRHGQNFPVRVWDLAGTPLDRDATKALQRKESIFQAVFAPLRKTGRA